MQTDLATVTIERLRVTKTQEGTLTGIPREMGTHEWHLKIVVNGQTQWWTRDGIETGGEYDVSRTFPLVPLDNDKLNIFIHGWEQDTFGDTELSSRSLTLTPAEDCPYGANGAWVTSYSSSSYGQFIAEEGMESEGGFDFRVSIRPLAAGKEDVVESYSLLLRDRPVYNEYFEAGWDAFTKQIDVWRNHGRRLSRISSCEADPARPSFSRAVERIYMGVFEPGDTGMPFWELDEKNFAAKLDEHWKVDQIRPTDIYAYRKPDGWVMLGASFDKGENRTELLVANRERFVRDFSSRSEQGQGLISIDSYFDEKERVFVGLFEHGIGASILWLDANETEIRSKDAQQRLEGWRMIDLTSFNAGDSPRYNAIWRLDDKADTFFGTAYGWDHLTSYVSFYREKQWQLVAFDKWSSAAKD